MTEFLIETERKKGCAAERECWETESEKDEGTKREIEKDRETREKRRKGGMGGENGQ